MLLVLLHFFISGRAEVAGNAAEMRVYDRIGDYYHRGRREDRQIAAALRAALGDASPVVNVGAGTGSYELRDRPVAAVEPSAVMLAQRPPGSPPAVRAVAEALPFRDRLRSRRVTTGSISILCSRIA
jgi:hypothetical protein